MKNKKVIYTAITGNYDNLITPKIKNDNWGYICFTDNSELHSEFWKIKLMDNIH